MNKLAIRGWLYKECVVSMLPRTYWIQNHPCEKMDIFFRRVSQVTKVTLSANESMFCSCVSSEFIQNNNRFSKNCGQSVSSNNKGKHDAL